MEYTVVKRLSQQMMLQSGTKEGLAEGKSQKKKELTIQTGGTMLREWLRKVYRII